MLSNKCAQNDPYIFWPISFAFKKTITNLFNFRNLQFTILITNGFRSTSSESPSSFTRLEFSGFWWREVSWNISAKEPRQSWSKNTTKRLTKCWRFVRSFKFTKIFKLQTSSVFPLNLSIELYWMTFICDNIAIRQKIILIKGGHIRVVLISKFQHRQRKTGTLI